jgi:hypothetical protein
MKMKRTMAIVMTVFVMALSMTTVMAMAGGSEMARYVGPSSSLGPGYK